MHILVESHSVQVTQVALFARVDLAIATVGRLRASVATPTLPGNPAIVVAQVALLGAIDLAVPTVGPELASSRAPSVPLIAVLDAVVTFLTRRQEAVATDADLAGILSAVSTRHVNARNTGAVPAGIDQTVAGAPITVHGIPIVAGFPPDHHPVAADGKAEPPRRPTAPTWLNLARTRAAVAAGNVAVVTLLIGRQNPVSAHAGRHARRIIGMALTNEIALDHALARTAIAVQGVAVVTFLAGVKFAVAAQSGANRRGRLVDTADIRRGVLDKVDRRVPRLSAVWSVGQKTRPRASHPSNQHAQYQRALAEDVRDHTHVYILASWVHRYKVWKSRTSQDLAQGDPMRGWLATSPQKAQRTQRADGKKESGLRENQPFPFRSGSAASVLSV
jgi:hypothetical protein